MSLSNSKLMDDLRAEAGGDLGLLYKAIFETAETETGRFPFRERGKRAEDIVQKIKELQGNEKAGADGR